MQKNKILFVISAIILAAASRLIPHIPNFTPISAMALFGGACLTDKRLAYSVPLIAMFLSDLFLGFHNAMIYVYASFVITTFIGIKIRENITTISVISGSVISSVIFFLITNYGVWEGSREISLGATYVLGIPFFGPTMAGDLFYNGILFGMFYYAQIRNFKLIKT